MLLCSFSMWAKDQYPTKMYMIGDATDAGWTLNNQAMDRLSDGVYRWEGGLKTGELKFAKEGADYGVSTDFWGPTTGGEQLVDGKILSTENLREDKKFSVNEGTYTLTLDLTKNVLRVGNFYDSKSGHYIYFKNTDNAWTNVYLRIGRADHVYTKPFEAIEGTDWWRCETPDYENYTHFTIIDNADATAPVSTYPDGANRLYEYSYDLTEDRWFILTDGPHTSGTHYYWNNTSDLNEYTVYVVPEELGFEVWNSESSLTLEVNWSDVLTVPINQEVVMSPIKEGSHIYKGITRIPVTAVYGFNFKRYQNDVFAQTFAAHYESLLSADTWNGKIFSQGKNDDRSKKWFDYPAPQYKVEAGYTIYFDNTKTKWAQPYLRVGRAKAHGYSGNHVHSYPFTRVGTTDIWTLTTEEYTEAEAWTISNVYQSEDENIYTAEYALKETMQRIFYYKGSIDKDICVKVTTDVTLNHDPWDVYYWGSEITTETPIYTRDVTIGRYGTICLPQASAACSGADFYTLVGKELKDGDPTSIVIETVSSLQAGVPYLFYATDDLLAVALTGEAVGEAGKNNGLVGSFEQKDIADDSNHYILYDNALWKVNQSIVGANRAYFDLSQMSLFDPAQPAQGIRKRMAVGTEETPSGIEDVASENISVRKHIVDGRMIIICGENIYNAQGQLIK